MKCFFAVACLFALSCGLKAQVVDTTVCEILKNPISFNNKIVRIKGKIAAGFDQFAIAGPECGQKVNAIWLAYPEGTKAKSGPMAMLQLQPAKNFSGTVAIADRTAIQLDKSKEFKQFDSLLSSPSKGSGFCLGCGRYSVSATFVGRIDGTAAGLKRDATGKIIAFSGFGNLNAYNARMVLQSVSDIDSQEIDYSKPPAPAPGEATPESQAGIIVANEFGAGSKLQMQTKRAADAFGTQDENNGVVVGNVSNEASAKNEAKGRNNSPDGILFVCGFDFSHLDEDSLARTRTHLGEHIADLRNPERGVEAAGAFQLEYRAWLTTALATIGAGQKSLMLPGGYLVWSSTWPPASLNKNSNDALKGYLANQELLSK